MTLKKKAKKDNEGSFITVNPSILSGERKSEAAVQPLKGIKDKFEEAKEKTEKASELFNKSIYECHRTAAELAAQLKKSTSIVRQSFDGVNSQLEKLQRTLSKDDAKDYAESLEKIATSLEKITELNDSGKLKEIFKAL